jgi:hypothetical protein
MAGTAAARRHGALLLPSHRRKTARTLARGAAAAGCYGPLFLCAHGRETARPAVKSASARRSDLAPPPHTHRRKTTRASMERTPAQRRDFTLLFGIHRRKAAPSFGRAIFLVSPPAAWCSVFLLQRVKPIIAPRSTIARGNFLLPSCPNHNIPFPFPGD